MAASAVVSLTSLVLWIALAVYVSNNGMLALYSTIVQCIHNSAVNTREKCFVVVQSLWREGSMRTLGSGVRTTPYVRPLLPTVSRMDWSWLA